MAKYQNCSYCQKPITCGCQKTRNSNGETVHKSCLSSSNSQKKT